MTEQTEQTEPRIFDFFLPVHRPDMDFVVALSSQNDGAGGEDILQALDHMLFTYTMAAERILELLEVAKRYPHLGIIHRPGLLGVTGLLDDEARPYVCNDLLHTDYNGPDGYSESVAAQHSSTKDPS